jgi:hypothetical protein
MSRVREIQIVGLDFAMPAHRADGMARRRTRRRGGGLLAHNSVTTRWHATKLRPNHALTATGGA